MSGRKKSVSRVVVVWIRDMGYTDTEKLLFVYLKYKFNLVSCVSSC